MVSDNGSFHVVLLTVNEKKIHFVRFLLKPKSISKPDIIYQLYIGSVRTVKYHDLGIENAELYQYISPCEPPDQRITYIIFPMSPHNHHAVLGDYATIVTVFWFKSVATYIPHNVPAYRYACEVWLIHFALYAYIFALIVCFFFIPLINLGIRSSYSELYLKTRKVLL